MTRGKTTVIIGAGMMGGGIAAISALAGNLTLLVGRDLERTRKCADAACGYIDELIDNQLAIQDDQTSAKELIQPVIGLENALPRADLVIESITENLAAKQELFQLMDEMLPESVPILSNTSGLRISDIALNMKNPGRAFTAHFWFPAHLVPLVEVVMGAHSLESMAVEVVEMLKSWGKAPVLVMQDLPGQLANRILQAVVREAVNIVALGIASPEDVDTAVKMGMGIRFPVWGPLEHIDAVGLDLATAVQNTVLPGISDSHQANRLLTDLVESGKLGFKSGSGIYDWNVKDMTALQQKRNQFIIQAVKFIRAH